MKIKVLGCSGAIAQGCRTTSFLVDDDVLIDAGTGVGDLTLAQMAAVQHVFLTHSHLDHVASLPLMIDSIAAQRQAPLRVHALAATIAALKSHVFNDVIWPDFSRIPCERAPLVAFEPLAVGARVTIGARCVEALPAAHTVPAVGYSVCMTGGDGCWVFSGDTGGTPAFWARINQLPVRMLVIETAFSNRERELAQRSRHLSPTSLAHELAFIGAGRDYPVYITHTKPAQTALIMSEIGAGAGAARHDIRWLEAGQEFEV